jgi:hypothetical protein
LLLQNTSYGSDINRPCKTLSNGTYANGMQQKKIAAKNTFFVSDSNSFCKRH